MVRYREHLGVMIEVFYLESGHSYAAFDSTDLGSYESDIHETFKEALSQTVEKINELLRSKAL